MKKQELEEKLALMERLYNDAMSMNMELNARVWDIEEELGALDAEFNTLAEENVLLKEVIANVFQGDEEQLTRFFTRLKGEWADEDY